ncbi:MAG: PDZ domain-containing protein [Sandaracinaceae bacterium]|nr:PDZ domain-containing protein [Sandaracinaceae bacterium]MBK7154489.1 PDZ domain-containing protein [Sandaracinaceae bacterium]MBP7682382.1 PDZ domain-containing protein [Deltaproteobacteria bacterium]
MTTRPAVFAALRVLVLALLTGLVGMGLLLSLSVGGCSMFGGSDEVGGILVRLGYSETSGLRVAEVPAGPAMRAGLREDDRITRIDGDDVSRMPMREIVERLRGPIGSTVEIEVVRDGEFQTFTVERSAYQRD